MKQQLCRPCVVPLLFLDMRFDIHCSAFSALGYKLQMVCVNVIRIHPAAICAQSNVQASLNSTAAVANMAGVFLNHPS